MTQMNAELAEPDRSDVNRAQRNYWEDQGARLYRDHEDTEEALLAPFGRSMLLAARLRPGEVVLDVGCGHGTSTLEAAERVAPSGRVVGVDLSAAMLEPAHRRVAAAGVDNVDLVRADAQCHAFAASSFDAVVSRFGVMFFEDPQAAFGNLARALRPGGRLVFTCPQEPLRSEWVAVAFQAAVAAVGRTPEVGPPGTPGPFALADGDYLTGLLIDAGFRDVMLESVTRPVRLGRDVGGAIEYVLSLPESEQLLAGAPRDVLGTARLALQDAFAPYLGSCGVVMSATGWLVSARR